MWRRLIYLYLLLLLSCSKSIDSKEPEQVIQYFYELLQRNKVQKSYKLLSTRSKKLFSLQEYRHNHHLYSNPLIRYQAPVYTEIPTGLEEYKRYKLKLYSPNSSDYKQYYYTLIREGHYWKVAFSNMSITNTLLKNKKKSKLELYQELLAINPFDANVYAQMAELNYETDNYSNRLLPFTSEAEVILVDYLRKAMELVPEEDEYHEKMAEYYSLKDKYNRYEGYDSMAIHHYHEAIKLATYEIRLNRLKSRLASYKNWIGYTK